jgi:thiamine biosynthesis protein ThiI
VEVRPFGSRLLLRAPDTVGWEALAERVGRVFGVANFSRSYEAPPTPEGLEQTVLAHFPADAKGSFRVTTTRSYKEFPLDSGQIDRRLGIAIFDATSRPIDLTSPDLVVHVEVQKDRIFVSFGKQPGPGGFPVGTGGRVLALLSGGIDSPVAAWRMMKRGCTVGLVHFHAFPLQDTTTMDKARRLARVLARWQHRSRLFLVPFGALQQTIVANCPAPLRVVLYRRFMVRIAEAIAERANAKALVTGESLGQVASQTLDNMSTIDAVARGPVLRPLVGMDKEEIVEQARRIGTFEISTLPDQDCCQLFVPRSPATAASKAQAEEAEQALDIPALVGAAVRETVDEKFRYPETL